jgi:hypothetical protein
MNLVISIIFLITGQFAIPFVGGMSANVAQTKELASEQISLEKRYDNSYVNNVFKDNILLNMAYLSGKVTKKDDIKWGEIEKPFEYRFVLMPNKTFAFHNDVLGSYKNSVVKTTNADFNFDDGFKSDGYLMGDGVCHLASLMYWVAKNAGLNVFAPTNHNFMIIPQIDKEYGVSIYKMPGQTDANAVQNLYITNNKTKPITFAFSYKNNQLKLTVFEVKNATL